MNNHVLILDRVLRNVFSTLLSIRYAQMNKNKKSTKEGEGNRVKERWKCQKWDKEKKPES